ncbi:MAG: FAD-dependent oxidoreductase [Thermoleophilaceae bacterium]
MSSAIVVGAGVFGASLARELADGGWDVTLVDPRRPGHPESGSGGESRLIRCSHGADRRHARSARRARELWRELEREAGVELLVEAGVCWFARREGGWESASEHTLRDEGIPVEHLDPADAARLFPSFSGDDLAFCLLEPEAGILRAARAVEALAAGAVDRGARLVAAGAHPEGGVVALDDGRRLEADRVVWACGAWLAWLFPELVELRVTRQDIAFFAAGPEWRTPGVPGWVDYDGSFYGLGDLDGAGMKAAPDAEGPPFDPERDPREPSRATEARAREYLRLRFPALGDAPLAGLKACHYEITPDTRFLLAPHPAHPHVWLLGGGSGHGFKHGPALAERAAAALRGDEPPDPELALGPRRPDRGLRTAALRATPGPGAG